MKRVLLTTLTFAFLTAGLHSVAQEAKTKEKTPAGAKVKAKGNADKAKVKAETADGQETKVVRQEDKVVVKGQGVGQQFDSAQAMRGTGTLDLNAVRQEINANNQLWGQAFTRGDSAAIVDLYHSEARIYPPNMAMMNARSDVGHMAAGMPVAGIQRAQLTTTDVIGNGDLVVETGTYEMGDANKVVDRGKYMVVWKQENGRWRIYRDIWNSDMPAGQH